MRAPAFWSYAGHPAARLLSPIGRAYGAFAAARMDRSGAAAACPVVCIGNFTLGGAGKTPTAIRIAALFGELGDQPVFLTRGYGGHLPGPVLVEPSRHTARDVGDEPLLLAAHAPTIVARDRPAGARLCAQKGASVIVMDDGLQNPSLRKDLALAVVDAGSGIGNGLTFPAGPLRAPLSRQWSHVGGLVLIGDGAPGEAMAAEARSRAIPVHKARLVPHAAEDMAGRAVLAFAGIGRPQKFFDSLTEVGAHIVAERAFPDHHIFREPELAELLTVAERLGAMLVTTAKDRVRLPDAMAVRTAVLQIGLRFADDAPVLAQLRERVEK